LQVSVGVGPVRAYGWRALLLYGWARGLWWLVLGAACHPRTTAVITVASLTVWAVLEHPLTSAAILSAVAELCASCAVARPAGFRRVVVLPALAVWRAGWVYRRLWADAMRAADLVADDGRVPRLGRVRCGDRADVVRVRGWLGQRFGDWEAAGPMLAHVFGAAGVVVHRGDDRRLTLELVRGRRGRSWNRGALDYGPDL
jgi:hypothetical protein